MFMPITRPLRIEQRAAAVARIERGVGLDHVVDQVARDAAQGAAERADDAGRHGRIEAERAADRDDELADAQAGRFAELGVRRARRPRPARPRRRSRGRPRRRGR